MTYRSKTNTLYLGWWLRMWAVKKAEIIPLIKRHNLDQKLHFHLHFYCLRHTFATMLMEKGINQKIIQFLLGHKRASTTAIYLHAAPWQFENASASLDKQYEEEMKYFRADLSSLGSDSNYCNSGPFGPF